MQNLGQKIVFLWHGSIFVCHLCDPGQAMVTYIAQSVCVLIFTKFWTQTPFPHSTLQNIIVFSTETYNLAAGVTVSKKISFEAFKPVCENSIQGSLHVRLQFIWQFFCLRKIPLSNSGKCSKKVVTFHAKVMKHRTLPPFLVALLAAHFLPHFFSFAIKS